jgi:hypothetical protein
MNNKGKDASTQILEEEDALQLWQRGRDKWNAWIKQNPGITIKFAGIDFSRKRNHRGVLSFRGYEFGNGNVDFSWAKFGKGEVDFSSTNFGDGDADFTEATFEEGNVNFGGATFGDGNLTFSGISFGSGDINFGKADFGDGNIDFSGVSFGNGNVSFEGTNFGEGNINFKNSKFGVGGVYFSKAVFGSGDKKFANVIFGRGYVDFSLVEFGTGEVDFSSCYFSEGELKFFRTNFGDGYVDFSRINCRLGELNLFETTFGNCDLSLSRAKLTRLTFQPLSFGLGGIEAENLSVENQTVFKLPASSLSITSLNLQGASFSGPMFLSGDLGIVPDLRRTKSSHQIELSSLNVKLRRALPRQGMLARISKTAESPDDAARLRRLKEIAETNKDHRAALRFSADENRARRWIETSRLGSVLDISFSACSDYGQNILRPFVSLLLLTLSSVGLYKTLANAKALTWDSSWGHAATLAASNSLPFLPQSRSLREDAIEVLYSNDPSLLVDAIMIGQGALSFIFLFLIGLGLRNRFRL